MHICVSDNVSAICCKTTDWIRNKPVQNIISGITYWNKIKYSSGNNRLQIFLRYKILQNGFGYEKLKKKNNVING